MVVSRLDTIANKPTGLVSFEHLKPVYAANELDVIKSCEMVRQQQLLVQTALPALLIKTFTHCYSVILLFRYSMFCIIQTPGFNLYLALTILIHISTPCTNSCTLAVQNSGWQEF